MRSSTYRRQRIGDNEDSDATPLLASQKSRGFSNTTTGLIIAVSVVGAVCILGWVLFGVFIPKVQDCGGLSISAEDTCVDWVIGGGGTSGLSAARRLASADGYPSVVVLEAGADLYATDDNIRLTRDVLTVLSYKDKYPEQYHFSWLMPLDPNTANQVNELLQGKVLGGGSSVNNGVTVKGTYGYWNNSVSAAVNHADAWSGPRVYERYKELENFTNWNLFTARSFAW